MGMFGSRLGMAAGAAALPQLAQPVSMPQPPQPKPSFFGDGGVGRNIAGSIGDFLLQNAGMQPTYAPAMANKLKARMEEIRAEREEAQWQRRYQQQLQDRRADRQPHRWESNDGSLMEMGPDGQPRVVYKDPTPKVQWFVNPATGVPTPVTAPQALPETLTDDDWGPGPGGPDMFP